MNLITLLYHDVVSGGDFRSSGFAGADADLYKMDRDRFARHLQALAAVIREPIKLITDANPGVLLTFDDGGASSLRIADMLEQHGWRGHFFIPTDYIGRDAFLTTAEIQELHRRGHAIGSHSATHPPRISHLPLAQIEEEWRRSAGSLADILGTTVELGSVPAGFYSAAVARAAGKAGIRILFNSEPVTTVRSEAGVSIVGRFSVQGPDEAALAAGLVSSSLPRFQQWTFWNAKKVLKVAGGSAWLALRKRFLAKNG